MITNDLATAQILFLLASDNRTQQQELKRDLQRSKYRYRLVLHSDKATLVESVKRQIAENDGKLPAVLVINYRFARKDCDTLLELVRRIRKSAAMECVVTNPPKPGHLREALVDLGARLFDSESGLAMAELTLH